MKCMRIWTIAILCTAPAAAPGAELVDYLAQIKPIFAKNCVSCHGPAKQKAGLRLDTVAAIQEGGNSGAILKPGKSSESLLIHAVTGAKPDVSKMPPSADPLSAAEIALLKRWIDDGAKGPAKEDMVVGSKPKSAHWAFQPVARVELPSVKDEKWVRNAIDRFVLNRLEKERIRPAPEADKVTLLRRVCLDLLGLPPTPAQVDAFLSDPSPKAYERFVDELLASPHFGERWGRHWLDAARYADSNGFTIDAPRNIWKYRDWVINALNNDLPFDRFTIEQLAGDLLPSATTDQIVATGFHRNTLINQEGGIDVEQFRIESVVDRVNTTGAVFLGLTIGCAQCHDHKYDPISQREYYQFLAYFNNADEPNLEIATPEVQKEKQRVRMALNEVEKRLSALDPTSPAAIEKWERGQTDDSRAKLPKAIKAVFEVAPNGRNAKQLQTLEIAYRRADQTRHVIGGLVHPFSSAVHGHLLTTRLALEKERDSLKKQEPPSVTTMVIRERKTPRMTHIHLGGDFLRKGVQVQPSTPAVLPPLQVSAKGGGNRLDFARWIVAPENPLTARVIMNRFWGQYFGAGIVETDNDFGTQGTPPTHPELLDYLASQFIRERWSMKAMHRLIVTSATYRQSSNARPDLALLDPRNQLLARQTRLRLESEVVRDVSLAASGLLSPKVGGPGVFPPQPDGVYRFTQIQREWKPSPGDDRYRRGMYTYFWRSAPHPALITFDAPDSTTTCTRRNRSNTPLQALTLLNDAGFYEYAVGLADRILKPAGESDGDRLRTAFRICLARTPTSREFERLYAFLNSQKTDLAAKPNEVRQLVGEATDASERAAWIMTARVLLNLDEFITRE